MKIKIHTDGEIKAAEIKKGESLLDAVNRAGIEGYDAPCGGKGTCGKCRVKLVRPELTRQYKPDSVENKFLTESEISAGTRLACRIFPESDIDITVSSAGKSASILTGFDGQAFNPDLIGSEAPVSLISLNLDKPSIEDQRSDFERIKSGLPESSDIPLWMIRCLPALLKKYEYEISVKTCFGKIVSVSDKNTAEVSYAVAVDIGTTTVVSYLVCISGEERGQVIDFVSSLNSQKGFGGDVISRIEFTMQESGNLDILQQKITNQISTMVDKLCLKAGIESSAIDLVTIAGNTTMMHLFAGLDPAGIAAAPFIPVDTSLLAVSAPELGLSLHEGCTIALLPSIASYVGADITAGIIATGMHRTDKLSLLIDIGTNGEIVLGNKSGMTACSTAAGPALEGANISCGMGGVPGAINRVYAATEKDISFEVIGGDTPAGICGSGIVDAVSVFLQQGYIDETGRIMTEEADTSGPLIIKDDGPELKVSGGITLTQKDIREIQMAKAAIAAGIATLLHETGKTVDDVECVHLAGGFGAALDRHNAAVIGLVPAALETKIAAAGNTAGKGAVMAALSADVIADMSDAARHVDYIELSTSAQFQMEYMNAMYFNKL